MNRFLLRACAGLGAGVLLIASAGLASADNVESTVAAGGSTTITLGDGTHYTDIEYWIKPAGPCDVSGGSPIEVTPILPATITSNVASMTFTACDARQTVRFTASATGTFAINSNTSTGMNASPAKVTLTVENAPNTAPTVAVSGVTDGAEYELGAVPGASCQVTDAEDGTSTHAADLSSVTGLLSAYGIGSQTATCTHTDSGGLPAASASVTYSIVDTTDPVLDGVPADQVIEATSSAGAVATWTDPTATDLGTVDSVGCLPAAGSTFAFGSTTVTCTATDKAGNVSSDIFTVTVRDTTAPSIVGGAGNTKEATGPTTPVSYTVPTATDAVDGSVPVNCSPASGSSFAVGSHTVTCTATDNAGNTSSVQLTVVVTDTTGPAITAPNVEGVEASGPGGATVSFSPTAVDLVDGPRDVSCVPASGSLFPLGTTTVNCTSVDSRGNPSSASFTVEVVDTTAPELTVPADITQEAAGPSGAVVNFAASATDTVDTNVTVSCIPASGSTFGLGATTVNCTAVDDFNNQDTASFTVTVVDTTPPAVSVPADITAGATSAAGAVVTYSGASASDLVDGPLPVNCSPASGSTFAPGANTVTCSATDAAGNTGSNSFTVTVSFAWTGFFAPVDNGGVFNAIKGGQSVPMKWRISDGGTGWISSLSVVSTVTQTKIACDNTAPTDEIEAPTSGATSLRYDTTANQYIYNWQSPKGASLCYRVTVHLTDGTSHSALFKTK